MDDSSGKDRSPSRPFLFGLILIFFLLIFATYWSSLRNEFVAFDDGLLIYENPVISDISSSSFLKIFTSYDPDIFMPLTMVSYQLDYIIDGFNPLVFSIHNLLLHTLTSLFVVWLVFLLSKRLFVAILTGFLFAIHPINTEAVVWLSIRKDLQATFFFLLGLIVYLSLYRKQRKTLWYVVMLVLFLCSLLSKFIAISFPFILLLLDFREEGKVDRKMLWEKVPFFLLSILFGFIALMGKPIALLNVSLIEELLVPIKSIIFYLQKIFVPTSLSVFYPFVGEVRLWSLDFGVPLLIFFVLLFMVEESKRWLQDIAFGFFFFIVTLFPTLLHFRKMGDLKDVYFASDHYAYLPSIGIIFLVSTLLLRWAEMGQKNVQKKRNILFLGSLVVIVLFSSLAYRQSLVWKDTETLFQHVVKQYPNAQLAHNFLGILSRENGKIDESIEHFRQSLEIRPTAKTYDDLGLSYLRRSNRDLAEKMLQEALKLQPNFSDAREHLDTLYSEKRNDARGD